jgi:hypothetical protein
MKSAKFQAPNSKEAPSTKSQKETDELVGPVNFGAWSLEFLWSLELGVWSFR